MSPIHRRRRGVGNGAEPPAGEAPGGEAQVLGRKLRRAPGRSPAAPIPEPIRRPWAEDVVYLIMIDRFHRGDRSAKAGLRPRDPFGSHGGDLQGVIDKLDYLERLGVTALWLTPVAQNQPGGYHGYWITDFYAVDERLGSLERLRRLVREAHRRQMKVLLDIVVNHVAPAHPWVQDPARYDWFHHAGGITDWTDQANIENGQLAGLPDLAQENPAVARYLLDMALWWVRETNVDGFRLDTVRHVPVPFWVHFAHELHLARPGFFLMGEVWNGDLDYLKKYLHAGLDSLVDYARFGPLHDVFARGADPAALHAVVERQARESPGTVWGTFIDNHDLPRFVTEAAPNGAKKLKLALACLFTSPGMPILYYGTEIAMRGGHDPGNRRDMRFDRNPDMQEFTARLIRLRKEHPAFAYGSYKPVDLGPKVVAYIREYGSRQYLVLLNNSGRSQRVQPKILCGRGEPLLGPRPTGDRSAVILEPWTPYVFTC